MTGWTGAGTRDEDGAEEEERWVVEVGGRKTTEGGSLSSRRTSMNLHTATRRKIPEVSSVLRSKKKQSGILYTLLRVQA